MNLIVYDQADVSKTKPLNLIKVPGKVYDIMADLARLQAHTIEQKRAKILKLLIEWCSDKYPGKVIINFIDYSIDEAALMSQKTGYNLEWGMYILLADGYYEGSTVESILISTPNRHAISNQLNLE